MQWYWGRTFGGPQDEEGYDFQQVSDSGFVLVGYTASYGKGPDNVFIAKTDYEGNCTTTVHSYVSVNEISEIHENTLVYPNPFSTDLFFKIDQKFFGEGKKIIIEITDLYGRKILTLDKIISPPSSEPIHVDIPAEKFTNGIYIATLESGNKKIYRKLVFAR
jgi:hypothetical protein